MNFTGKERGAERASSTPEKTKDSREGITHWSDEGKVICLEVPKVAMTNWSSQRDASARSHQMPRNRCLLYRNRNPKNEDSPSYLGVLRLDDGRTFWVGLWKVTVCGQLALEIRLEPKACP